MGRCWSSMQEAILLNVLWPPLNETIKNLKSELNTPKINVLGLAIISFKFNEKCWSRISCFNSTNPQFVVSRVYFIGL